MYQDLIDEKMILVYIFTIFQETKIDNLEN